MNKKNIQPDNPFIKMLRIFSLSITTGCFLLLIAIVLVSYFTFRTVADWKMLRSEQNITSTFYEYTEKLKAVSNLVLVERTNLETVERVYSREIRLPFFENGFSSEAFLTIRCRVFYSYYVDMKGKWNLKLEGKTLYVKAPPLQCLPPAIDTSQIERKTENGWLVFGEPALLKELEKDLSFELYRKAIAPPSIQNVTPEARKSLEKFISTWIMNKNIRADNIIVSFRQPERKKL